MTLKPFDPKQAVDELLREKSLLSIWLASLRIRRSRSNRWIRWGSFAGVSTYVFALPHDAAALVETTRSMATLWLPTMLSLLGFLLAGLTFFVSSERLAMLKTMARFQNTDTGLSVLKENLFAFVRPLVELLLISVSLFVALVIAAPGSWQVTLVKSDASGTAAFYVSRCGFVAVAFSVVLGFVAVKSAIRNVYHIVMTGLRWELESEADAEQ
ncbi:MAG TPA: hypothetical protein VFZ65_04030 [Planctomycetota bacterium]|nr:hypothetical protein [Planctomycetota bacterium]